MGGDTFLNQEGIKRLGERACKPSPAKRRPPNKRCVNEQGFSLHAEVRLGINQPQT
jgi:hypothetical protein